MYTWLCVEKKILQSRSFQNIDKTCSKKGANTGIFYTDLNIAISWNWNNRAIVWTGSAVGPAIV